MRQMCATHRGHPSAAIRRPPEAGSLRAWLPAALVLLLLLGAVVRLTHLADNPRWDGDEGYNWSIAANLAAGRVQRFALRYTFVDHPPLFYFIGALFFKLWTATLLVLRLVSALCGAIAILGTFAVGARVGGTRLGIIAAGIYALWPQAILQSRWAYTYNLVTPLLLFSLWAALPAADGGVPGDRYRWRKRLSVKAHGRDPTLKGAGQGSRGGSQPALAGTFPARVPGTLWVRCFQGRTPAFGCRSRRYSRRSAALAGLLAGLALATDQEAIAVVLAVGLALWWSGGPRAAALGMGAAVVPPALYIAWMLGTRGAAFQFDIRHTATRVGGGGAAQDALTLLARFIQLCQFDLLIAVGLYGLFLLPRGIGRRSLLALTALLLLVVLQVRDPNPYFRAAIPILPLCAIGLAAIVEALARGARRSGAFALVGRRGTIAGVALLATLLLSYDLAQATGSYTTAIDFTLPRSTQQARAMATWINRHTRRTDLVIIMPQTAWLLRCRTAELLQAVAITGHGTAFYPAGLGPARFAYDAHLAASRYLVVDDFTRLWIQGHAGERALVAIARRRWPVVYRQGEYTIYANPTPRAE